MQNTTSSSIVSNDEPRDTNSEETTVSEQPLNMMDAAKQQPTTVVNKVGQQQQNYEPKTANQRAFKSTTKKVLKEKDCKGELGFHFSPSKKWLILSIIFLVQISMNFNASVYGNAISGLKKQFDITEDRAIWGQAFFLIAYAFGCELWYVTVAWYV